MRRWPVRCVALGVVHVIAHGLERAVVAAAKQWKYKVKLTPGAAKRGAGAFDVDDVIQSMSQCVVRVCMYVCMCVCVRAAVKSCIAAFLKEQGETPREHQLIKLVDVNELNTTMISAVQVWTTAGGSGKKSGGGSSRPKSLSFSFLLSHAAF